MIKKNIKTIWEGKAGIHQKYLGQARSAEVGIHLFYKGNEYEYKFDEMVIPFEDLHRFTRGDDEFEEQFGPQRGQTYHLYYIPWEKTNRTLFD